MKGNVLAVMAFCLMILAFASPASAYVPDVDSVDISPSVPEGWDDLACTAVVSDPHGELSTVMFSWYRNTVLVRQSSRTVSGYSGVQSDTLNRGFTEPGDQITCKVEVWDLWGNSDAGDATVNVQDEYQNSPPVMRGIPDQEAEIGEEVSIDLWDYAYDVEDSDYDLDFALDSQGNTGVISCGITGDRYVYCGEAEQLGQSALTVRVTDSHGAWDTDTFIISVTGECEYCDNEAPVIESIDIDPDHPDEDEDVTCEVHVEDEDGNLEEVEFRWYVDGDLERTRIRDVSGYSDTAEDTLDSSETDEDDEVECRVTVSDDDGLEDHDSRSVDVDDGDDDCRIQIYDLEVEDEEEITFRIRNRGDDDTDVEYRIYVDGDKVESDDINVDEDESRRITFYYDDFEEGESYEIKVKAEADCGDEDQETVTYDIVGDCDSGYLNIYRCSGNWLQRRYRDSDCDLIWKNWQYCSQGCSSDSCTGTSGTGASGTPSAGCLLSIDGFDYSQSVAAGGTGSVSATIRNTGTYTQEFSMDVYLDGTYLGRKRFVLSPGSSIDRVWNFNVATAGSHTVGITVYSDCGASDSRQGFINSVSSGSGSTGTSCNYNQVCESGESWGSCPYDCAYQDQSAGPTGVDVSPSSIDVGLYRSKVVSIDIDSAVSQDFRISVSGVPESWLSYSETVEVDGSKTSYVFISPKETGSHTVAIEVEALSEGLTFSDEVEIFVIQSDDQDGQDGDGVTGMITIATSLYAVIVVIIIASAIVIWYGFIRLKTDDDVTFDKR